MTNLPALPAKATVIKAYESEYTEPLVMSKGSEVTIMKRESEWPGWIWCQTKAGDRRWVAKAYLIIDGNRGILNRDYEATELTAQIGDMVKAIFEEAGWVWCESKTDNRGWLPVSNLHFG